MFNLLEKIVQIEDLSLPEFLHTVSNLATLDLKKATKGLSFFFGLDDEGKLFSSKYSADDKFYSTLRYQKEPDNNAMIGAHKFIFKFKHKIEKILEPNDLIECRVQFYDVNTFDKDCNLILLKGEHLSELLELLSTRTLIRSAQTFSLDGRNTSTIDRPSYWNAKEPKGLDKLDTSGIKDELEKLKDYLSTPSDVDKKYNNFEIVKLNLGSIKMDKRSIYKTERDKVNDYIQTTFKLPIKNLLIDKNDELQIDKDEDTIEIKDNNLMKTSFFLQPKHELAGIIRTTDPSAKLELRGGLFGEVMQRIATLFGVPEMANIQSAEKVFRELKGETLEATAANFSESLGRKNFFTIKTKLIAVFNNLQKDIDAKLDAFKHDSPDYELKLSDDVILKYEKEDIQTNLNAFGELSDEIIDILHQLKVSTALVELVAIIFRRPLELVHNEIVKESTTNLHSLSCSDICYAYMANYLCALILLRNKDHKASSILKDFTFSLRKAGNRSRLNHWGHLVFGSNYGKESQKVLNSSTYKQLSKIAGRVIDRRIKFVHTSISRQANLLQDWRIHEDSVKLFLIRLETYESGLKDCIEVITKWDDANLSDKTIAVNKLYFYLQRHDPASPLFPRMKELASSILLNRAIDNETKGVIVQEHKTLLQMIAEDDGITPAPMGQGGYTSVQGSTTADSIAGVPKRLFKNQVVIRRVRNFEKKRKFARPDQSVMDASNIKNSSGIKNAFENFKSVVCTKSIILEWSDNDCFKPNYAGYDFVRKEYNLVLDITEAKTTWPSVKILGRIPDIERFLSEQYQMEPTQIRETIGE